MTVYSALWQKYCFVSHIKMLPHAPLHHVSELVVCDLFDFAEKWSVEKAAVDYAVNMYEELLRKEDATLFMWLFGMDRLQYEEFTNPFDCNTLIVRLDGSGYYCGIDLPTRVTFHIKDCESKWSFSIQFDFTGLMIPDFIEDDFPELNLAQPRLLWVVGDAKEFRNWILLWKLTRGQEGEEEE